MLSLEVYKDRRCATCTEKDQEKFGCEKDIQPFSFDGEKITRCPLRPFREDPRSFSEYFQLYSFREKNIPAEVGAFYDQPAVYIEIMQEIDSAMSDSMSPDFKKKILEDENKKVDALKSLGIPITPKK